MRLSPSWRRYSCNTILCSKKDVATWIVSAKIGEVVAKHEHRLAQSVDGALAVKSGKIFAVAEGGKRLCMMPLQGTP